jgi:hypothetical protein
MVPLGRQAGANGRAKLQQRARSSAACQALDRHQDVDETASAL